MLEDELFHTSSYGRIKTAYFLEDFNGEKIH